jgi:hypothetical protein
MTDPQSPDGQKLVYCVICLDVNGGEALHIFSSREKAQAYVDADSERGHVIYDYVIDCPERMEGHAQ